MKLRNRQIPANENPAVSDLKTKFKARLDNYEYCQDGQDGKKTQLRHFKMTFTYKLKTGEVLSVQCEEHMWYHAHAATPAIFDKPHGFSMCQNYTNYCYIAFLDAHNRGIKKRLIRNIVSRQTMEALFDFIHLESLRICKCDPFAIVFKDITGRFDKLTGAAKPDYSCYQQWLKKY
jgi:hypothetical protein